MFIQCIKLSWWTFEVLFLNYKPNTLNQILIHLVGHWKRLLGDLHPWVGMIFCKNPCTYTQVHMHANTERGQNIVCHVFLCCWQSGEFKKNWGYEGDIENISSVSHFSFLVPKYWLRLRTHSSSLALERLSHYKPLWLQLGNRPNTAGLQDCFPPLEISLLRGGCVCVQLIDVMEPSMGVEPAQALCFLILAQWIFEPRHFSGQVQHFASAVLKWWKRCRN